MAKDGPTANSTTEHTADRGTHRHLTRTMLNRWRWYHLYFVLALFDVAVIVAGVVVHRTTLRSFDRALADVDHIQEQQRWFAELRTALLAMNAPGNDIFESRDLPGETGAFSTSQARLVRLLDQPPLGAQVPQQFRPIIERMAAAAGDIFERFEGILDETAESDKRRRLLADATRLMASMDRAQVHAMAALTEATLTLLVEQQAILDTHKATLDGRTSFEIVFVVIVALILVGVFWYGRRLQRTHEDLLTEQERVETERRNRLAAVGEVCYACAHGIRNPISSIASSAQLILEYGHLDADAQTRTRDIVASCDRLSERVSRLLTFAHAQSATMELLTPEEVLDAAAREIQGQLDGRGIELDRRYEATGVRFPGNTTWLIQAVGELLSNAMHELDRGGTITLVSAICQQDPRLVELGVMDTGRGIPPEIRDRVMQLFYSQRPDGHGIGLASVQRAADLHRGSVVIADAEPHGADVRLRIPVS